MLYDKIILALIDLKKSIKEKFGDDGQNIRGGGDWGSGPFGFDRIHYEIRRIAAAIRHTTGGGGSGGGFDPGVNQLSVTPVADQTDLPGTATQKTYDGWIGSLINKVKGLFAKFAALPVFGTAAAKNVEDFASAAQGAKADSAVQTETDPTVPSWAKAANKPSYTPGEVGAATTAQGATADAAAQGVADIQVLIPVAAAVSNLLADQAFVNSSIQNMAANPAFFNTTKGWFPTAASVAAATVVYDIAGEPITGSLKNNYFYVLADEAAPAPFTGGINRWAFAGDTIDTAFRSIGINNAPFTQAQADALNSGVTAALLTVMQNATAAAQAKADAAQNAATAAQSTADTALANTNDKKLPAVTFAATDYRNEILAKLAALGLTAISTEVVFNTTPPASWGIPVNGYCCIAYRGGSNTLFFYLISLLTGANYYCASYTDTAAPPVWKVVGQTDPDDSWSYSQCQVGTVIPLTTGTFPTSWDSALPLPTVDVAVVDTGGGVRGFRAADGYAGFWLTQAAFEDGTIPSLVVRNGATGVITPRNWNTATVASIIGNIADLAALFNAPTEQLTGKTLGGKPVYVRRFVGNIVTGTNIHTLILVNSGVKDIVSKRVKWQTGISPLFLIDEAHYYDSANPLNGNRAHGSVILDPSNGRVSFENISDTARAGSTNNQYDIILEYTKV